MNKIKAIAILLLLTLTVMPTNARIIVEKEINNGLNFYFATETSVIQGIRFDVYASIGGSGLSVSFYNNNSVSSRETTATIKFYNGNTLKCHCLYMDTDYCMYLGRRPNAASSNQALCNQDMTYIVNNKIESVSVNGGPTVRFDFDSRPVIRDLFNAAINSMPANERNYYADYIGSKKTNITANQSPAKSTTPSNVKKPATTAKTSSNNNSSNKSGNVSKTTDSYNLSAEIEHIKKFTNAFIGRVKFDHSLNVVQFERKLNSLEMGTNNWNYDFDEKKHRWDYQPIGLHYGKRYPDVIFWGNKMSIAQAFATKDHHGFKYIFKFDTHQEAETFYNQFLDILKKGGARLNETIPEYKCKSASGDFSNSTVQLDLLRIKEVIYTSTHPGTLRDYKDYEK